ncbi:MAG: hypothetical protein A3C06_00320 [Candidatus Taylorbacteria bacterium RIFCSPHIGHO2_02_FULL_46_13]|uniref:Cell shape-determining protein MreC n=1 Tax=Candidatus Taylorbacteria bacterium RIFCSPHIGHO2_02_FULL_46_13 TaxID=1802312 RepID=A0A1G2MPU0_9BACT|nr:MAG: hypothetical protein A3C06_00320 [Candidatus Taylorbacteria bacterium RIFCSPHIGHO2_02_FULL_46_13]
MLLLLFVVQEVWPSFLPNMLYRIATPLFYSRNWIADSLKTAGSYVSSRGSLALENQRLSTELTDARERLLQLEALQTQLKELQLFSSRSDHTKRIFSVVLLRPPLSPYDTLVLDVGIDDGVSAGDMVFSIAGSSAVGKITEVFQDFSRATLFSSPGNQFPVFLGAKSIQATAYGVGGGAFQLLLPREMEVAVGDMVTFPSLNPSVVGVVQLVEHQAVDFLQHVSFRSPVNFNELRYVAVEVSGQIKDR